MTSDTMMNLVRELGDKHGREAAEAWLDENLRTRSLASGQVWAGFHLDSLIARCPLPAPSRYRELWRALSDFMGWDAPPLSIALHAAVMRAYEMAFAVAVVGAVRKAAES